MVLRVTANTRCKIQRAVTHGMIEGSMIGRFEANLAASPF
jgi:hypothetical protein